MATKCCGPGYASPLEAMQSGPREKLLYVVTVQPNLEEPHGDYLSTVDVDPASPTYSQVIHRTFTNRKGNELHHSGWNACSSCHKMDASCATVPKRDKLVLPCLKSNAVYVVDTGKEPRKPEIFKIVEGEEMLKLDACAPHTSHCLANGNIMISTMGDREGNAKGDFVLLNSDFEIVGTWTNGDKALCGYDFWYQPYFNIMVASEWGAPKLFNRGFAPEDLALEKEYGRRLNFYNWKEQKLIQTIHLGDDGLTPFEIRFMHNPKRAEGFVGCCVKAKVFRFYRKPNSDQFTAELVIDIPAKKVEGWMMDEVYGMMSDIILSLDDRFLYFSNCFHGDVRQYDITDPAKPKLVGQIFLGGVLTLDKVKLIQDKELKEAPKPVSVKGRRLHGGPQMLQLSLDGKRLYVSTSLHSSWDKQFYPEMVKAGGTIVQLDVNTEKGGLKLNENFLVDFGKEPYGPTLPHEMRYPGGDCTSDIWLVDED